MIYNHDLKDRIERSKRDSPWAHLNENNSFNICSIKKYDT